MTGCQVSGLSKRKAYFFEERNLKILVIINFLQYTGSQGEPLGALNRIAEETHPHLRFKKGDRIVFSSRMIPGNEVSINNLINKLVYKGVDVVFLKKKIFMFLVILDKKNCK